MTTQDNGTPSFDGLLESIRHDEPTRAEIDGAADRVRARLGLAAPAVASVATDARPRIESCEGFQALIPDHIAGRLSPEMALLLEDHGRECIPCRRALIAARRPHAVPAAVSGARRGPAYTRWAAAAVLASAVVLAGYTAWQAFPLLGTDPQLKVMRVDGSLFQVRDGALVALRPGMTVSAKSAVRTAKDSGALVMMDDGSRIEMRDRTELSVGKRRDGATVRLGGGAIIVEASPQGSGHLDVRTDDCLVAVKGTIFAVNHGTRGSRVSVVEGAVRVSADGKESLLKPGDQITTSDNLTGVAVQDEFAWSHDAARYVQLLHELASLRKDLDARVPAPGRRYDSRLLDRMPDGTVLYAAIPNLTESLVEAKKVFEEHVAQSGALQSWWSAHMSSPEDQKRMDEAFDRMREYGSQLGDEIVLSLTMDRDGRVRGPVVTAEVKDPQALKRMIVKDLRKADNGRQIAREHALSFDDGVMRLEPSGTADAPSSTSKAASAGTTAWVLSPLRAKLQAAYADGASWLFAVDLKTMLSYAADQARAHGTQGESAASAWERTGVMDAEYLVFERSEGPDGATHRAEITFDQPRRGMMGWLAAPAPLGAIEFVSPDAGFAAAAVMKRPELLFAEALSIADADGLDLKSEAAGGAEQEGIDALQHLASTLGGDVAVALDGPVLPVPSWKFAVEVYDPAGFQTALDGLVAWANGRADAGGETGRIVLDREDVGNRIDWVVRFTGAEADKTPMRYTVVDGYVVAAPSRVLLDRAIEQRRNGYTLTRSSAFLQLLPPDGQVNVSGFVWEHLGPTVGPLAEKFAGVVDSSTAREIEAMAAESRPRLVTAYAEANRIVIGSRGEAGIGSLLGSLIGLENLSVLGRMAEQAHHAGAAEAQGVR